MKKCKAALAAYAAIALVLGGGCLTSCRHSSGSDGGEESIVNPNEADFSAQTKLVETDSLGGAADSASSSDESIATVAVADGVVTVTSVAAGTATITVAKSGYSNATFTVTVAADGSITVSDTVQFAEISKDAVLSGISASSSKASFFVGDAEPTWSEILSVNAIYDGTTETAVTDFSAITVAGWNSTAAGEITLTVTYEGKTTTFTVTIAEHVLTGISAVSSKTSFFVDDAEPTWSDILTVYSILDDDESTKTAVTDYTVTGWDSSAAGDKTLTVTYGGKTTTFTVAIVVDTVSSIAVTTATKSVEIPINTSEDDLKALFTVTATYKSGKTDTVTDFTISGYTSTKSGEQTVKVVYEGKSYSIKVTVKVVASAVLSVTDTYTYALSEENLKSLDEANAWNVVASDNFTSKTGTLLFKDAISAYNLSSTDRCISMNVSGVVSADLYVFNNSGSREFTVTVGEGEAQTFTHDGSGDQKFTFTTGTTDAVTITIAGGGKSVYPLGIVFYPTEVSANDFTVDVPVSTSDITLSVSSENSNTLTVANAVEGASYAWYVDDVLVSGATSSSYTLTDKTVGVTYEVRVVVTADGKTYSASEYVLFQ